MTNFATKEAFDVYCSFIALEKHFNSSYDFHKYNGKVKISSEKFITNPDAYQFYKVSKTKNWFDLLLANFIEKKKFWIGDSLSDDGVQIYTNWKRKIDSLSYTFESELKQLNSDFQSNFIVKNGSYPKTLQLFIEKTLSLETFAILLSVTNVTDYWLSEISDQIFAKDRILFANKYLPFLKIEKKYFSDIVKRNFLYK